MIVDELPLPSCMEISPKFYFDASQKMDRERQEQEAGGRENPTQWRDSETISTFFWKRIRRCLWNMKNIKRVNFRKSVYKISWKISGVSTLSARTTRKRIELPPAKEEDKVYFQAHMEARQKKLGYLAACVPIVGAVVGMASTL